MNRSAVIEDPLARVAADLRACAESMSLNARIYRAGLKQVYCWADLAHRYRGFPEPRLRDLLDHVCGYKGARGKRCAIHLDQVLLLDRHVAVEMGQAPVDPLPGVVRA